MIGLLLALAACEDVEENYSSFAEAKRAGAMERGWVPEFVPASASDIRDAHNLDTNAQTLEFTIDPSDLETMLAGLRPVSAEDGGAAAKLSSDLRMEGDPDAYVVCSDVLDGVLLVNRRRGRAVYRTPVDWVNDDCPRSK